MKKNGLVVEMVIFFLLITFLFTAIIIYEKGNPIKFYLAHKQINEYLDKHYSNWQDEFILSKLTYNKDTESYVVDVIDNKNNINFEIRYTKSDEIMDTHEDNLKEEK